MYSKSAVVDCDDDVVGVVVVVVVVGEIVASR